MPGNKSDSGSNFQNFGFEEKKCIKIQLRFFEAKFYKSINTSQQGGSNSSGFNFRHEYPIISNYNYPNAYHFLQKIFFIAYQNNKNYGSYKKINTDAAGNVIYSERDLGLGQRPKLQIRFCRYQIINPAFRNPNITDEKGFTQILALEEILIKLDLSLVSYQDRIGFVQRAYRDGSCLLIF